MGRSVSLMLGVALALLAPVAGRARADLIRTEIPPPAPEVKPPPPGFAENTPESKPPEELEKALQAFQRGDPQEALQLLKKAVEKQPVLLPARLLLAEMFLANNEVAKGRAALEMAAIEHPDHPGTSTRFGQLAYAEGHWSDAGLHFEKGLRLCLSSPSAAKQTWKLQLQCYEGLAALAERRKDWRASKTCLSALLAMEPKNGKLRERYGQALFHLDLPKEAVEELTRAVQDDSSLPPAAVTMAWLFTQKGDVKEAGKWIDEALRSPKDWRALHGVAQWLLEQGQTEKAKSHAEAAAKLEPNSGEVKLLRGLIARQLKDYAQAEGFFQALLQESPRDFQAINQLALVLVEQQDKAKRDRALQLAAMSVQLYPESAEAYATLGWVYYRLGKLDAAERALQTAASGGVMSLDTSYYLAHVLRDRGREDEAKQLLKKAVDSPGSFTFRQEAREWLNQIAKKAQ